VSWAAIFGAASVAGAAAGTVGAVVLIAAIGLGSLLWFTMLTVVAGWLVRRTGDRWATAVESGCGVGLVGFGGWLGWHTTTS
jgi:threonine/homoserine/homoserine lactone efflux protein